MKKSESTDLALAESLRTLMMRMPFEKITIKDITDEANVIRTTFYNHFQDKYDLLDWIYYEYYIKPSNQLIENNMLLEAFTLMIKNMEKDKEFLLKRQQRVYARRHVQVLQGRGSQDGGGDRRGPAFYQSSVYQ